MTRTKNTLRWLRVCLSVAGLSLVPLANANGQEFIPRTQKVPPGPAISPKDAIEKMQVPEGFRVELVAAEPSIQNPVAMAFDDAGRIYVTESFEYPRRESGPGRDTIKILQDKDGCLTGKSQLVDCNSFCQKKIALLMVYKPTAFSDRAESQAGKDRRISPNRSIARKNRLLAAEASMFKVAATS
jgi:hypothetical protein